MAKIERIKKVNTTDQETRISAAIEKLSVDVDIIALVKDIEGRIKTTKYNYGAYMSSMTRLCPAGSENRPVMLHIIGQAMILAGADMQGVNWAYKILLGR
jgi:hypothetical protein